VQRIDGFLAVLTITGGSFSPKAKKLPFAVNSVDGDKCLLYYSSIDLAGHLSSGKPGSPKMKRSLSVNDSPSEHSHLRVPMKGRIQLVSTFSWTFKLFPRSKKIKSHPVKYVLKSIQPEGNHTNFCMHIFAYVRYDL